MNSTARRGIINARCPDASLKSGDAMRRMVIFLAFVLGMGCRDSLAEKAAVEKLMSEARPIFKSKSKRHMKLLSHRMIPIPSVIVTHMRN